MKLRSLILLFFLIVNDLSANGNQLDSLFVAYKESLVESVSDSSTVNLLNKIAFEYHTISIDSTRHYANLALLESQKKGIKYEESRAYNILGIAELYNADFIKALELQSKAYEIAKEIDHAYLITASTNALCIIYERLNNIELCIYYGNIALKASKELGSGTTGYILSNLTNFHFDSGNYDEVVTYNNEIMKLANQNDDCNLYVIGHRKNGQVNFVKDELDAAMIEFNKSIEYAKECVDEYALGTNHYWVSKVHYANKEYDAAKKSIEKSNKILKKVGVKDLHLRNYLAQSDIELKLGQPSAAIKTLEEGLDKASKSSQTDLEIDFISRLASVYKERKNYAEALSLRERGEFLKDSINVFNKSVSMLEWERRYGLEKKEVEVQLLQEQKKIDAQLIKTRNYFLLALTLFAILVGAIAFFTFLNLRKEAKYNSQLETKVEERTNDLVQSNELLKKSNEELERFAYISSHDLKEPIKTMSSFAKLIKEESLRLEIPKITEYSNILEDSSSRLNLLMSDILDYSMLKTQLVMDTVDLNNIVNEIRSDLKESIASKNAIIEADSLPKIVSDKSKMYQAFKNLIENGIKYNENELPKVFITSEESGDSWKIKFADNGIGIDPQHHEQIFTMFKRLHNKDDYPGSGIGLTAVKTIMDKLKGDISIKSKPDEGSEFVITLPKAVA